MVKSSRLLVIPLFLFISLLFLRIPNPNPNPPTGLGIESLSSSICNPNFYPPQWQLRSDQLTVLINGFSESRLPLLQKIARSYSSFPCVHSVFILWGNSSTPSTLLETLNFESLGAPIYILRNPSSSLNDRFLPRDFISTRAVLICDDDVEIQDSASLSFALRVWSQHRRKRIVGFFGRSHGFELETGAWIYTVHPDRYSIILTKLMIVGTEFLYLYTCHSPKGVREFVDKVRNCEDIAMNFIVADRTGVGPVLVEGSPRDWGDTRNSEGGLVVDAALSSLEDHRKRRGGCITEFHKLWGHMPLRYSYGVVSQRVREQGLCRKLGVVVPCDQFASLSTDRP
ncbi:hypothetical protein KI387_017263 [Taxus chinensis]|uniref:Glycosyl transferase 64 domain-containing protein n=1 Tax=Taxus chinensis TaxID=29808 RepID=A0AA38LFM5_TAXCH|nr:hypothetical protein KI387_017263 [Taxus chinensis]